METDHCAICFLESDLQKCNKCTALYCKKCSQIVKSKYSNVCSVCRQYRDCAKVHPEPPPGMMFMNGLFTRIDNFIHSPEQQNEPPCSFCCRPNQETFLETCELHCLCRCCCCHCFYWRCCCTNTWLQNVYLTLTTGVIIGPTIALIVCFA